MARPALSSSRTAKILDLLTAFPGRGFSTAEIVRATGINVASCHAVLNALLATGYLVRDPKQLTFLLGPALVALGQAAVKSHPLVELAQQAAQALHNDTGAPVLLTTLAGDDVLALSSLADRTGRTAGMRVGQRMPLVPPIGAHFLAWAAPAQIEAWMARARPDAEARAHWTKALELVRERGFQVTLRTFEDTEFSSLMSQLAAGRQPLEYKDQASDLMSAHGWKIALPLQLEPNELYDVVLIAAPIFDRAGEAALSLSLGGFTQKLSGAMIKTYGDQLMRACISIMQQDRAQFTAA